MPTRKKAPQSGQGSTQKGKKASKASAAAGVKSGLVPPYGIAIRQAIARGNLQEMKTLATATRKWLREVESALDQLDSSLKKPGA